MTQITSPNSAKPDPVKPDPAKPEPDRAAPLASDLSAIQSTPPPRRREVRAVLVGLGFLLLFVGLAWLWREEQRLAFQQGAVDPAEVAGLQGQVRALTQRLATLEQRPVPTPPPPPPAPPRVDLAPLESRIAALEKRPAVPAADPALTARIEDLQKRVTDLPAPDPALPGRIDDLQKRLAAIPTVDPAIGGRVDDLQKRLAAIPVVDPAIAGRVDDLQKRLAQTQAEAARNAGQAARVASLQAAQAALDAGQPLGDLPGAPPALARFGRAKPPTEAALRLAFPLAADRAMAASSPSTAGENFGQRMWQNARSLVTIRQGDRVVLGAPASETIGHARERLDAGDLAGAVAALGDLDGPAAQAIADWRDQARALLDARGALAGMARG